MLKLQRTDVIEQLLVGGHVLKRICKCFRFNVQFKNKYQMFYIKYVVVFDIYILQEQSELCISVNIQIHFCIASTLLCQCLGVSKLIDSLPFIRINTFKLSSILLLYYYVVYNVIYNYLCVISLANLQLLNVHGYLK